MTFLGGEPFEEENQKVLAPFLEKIKQTYPSKDIWCWTGYVLEKDLLEGGRIVSDEELEKLHKERFAKMGYPWVFDKK